MSVVAMVEGKSTLLHSETMTNSPAVMEGNHFDLTIKPPRVNFTGKEVKAIAINRSIRGPTLKWREGETVTVALTSHLREETSIHWQGLRIPAPMDGVSGLSFAGIAPRENNCLPGPRAAERYILVPQSRSGADRLDRRFGH